MRFPRLIRSVCITLNALVLAAWIASHIWIYGFTHFGTTRFHHAVGTEGNVGLSSGENDPTAPAFTGVKFYFQRPPTGIQPHPTTFGFYFQSEKPPDEPALLIVPYWFLQLCTLTLTALLWHITRRPKSTPAFPVQPASS